MHQSILSYKRSRYLWWSSTMCLASIVAYWMHEPLTPPNGGTWLGYTLGTLGALLILLLMWFGIRKRSYRSRIGTLQGWLSAHIYLGIGLITVVTLHTGFQFGWNLHTLSYVLMLLVIASGLVGVYCYLHFPRLMGEEGGDTSTEGLIKQIREIDHQAIKLAGEIDDATHEMVVKSIQRNRLGGGVLELLFGRGRGRAFDDFTRTQGKADGKKKESDTLMFMASHIASGRLDRKDAMRHLSDLLVGQKATLEKQLRRKLQIKAFMDIWLYFHVPLSFALLAALIAHVVSVFFYW